MEKLTTDRRKVKISYQGHLYDKKYNMAKFSGYESYECERRQKRKAHGVSAEGELKLKIMK